MATTTCFVLGLVLSLSNIATVAADVTSTPFPAADAPWITTLDGAAEVLVAHDDYDNEPPAVVAELKEARRRFLAGSTSGYEQEFIDGSESYYNDYAQAWRLLGFYTDCHAPHNNFNECDGDGDGNNNNGNSGDGDQPACQRYLMWAAYIDLDYAGGKIGEYQFYDRSTQRWDATSCGKNKGRCAKMDCHLPSTHFKLLGFFKEPNYHEWMEQLFKHQGVCLWTNDEYYFMETDRYLWPCDCTATSQTDEEGNTLYYDARPMPEARLGLGLYTDSRCMYDYTGPQSITDVLGSVGGDIADLEQSLEKWNDAFDVFKVCQPCKAYNLGYNTDLDNGQGDREGGSADEDGGYAFDCYDDADYVNVNQCMKFKTKTEMLAADFRDLMLAHEQGNIVEFEVSGFTYGYGGYNSMRGDLSTDFSMSGKGTFQAMNVAFLGASMVFAGGATVAYLYLRGKESLMKKLQVPLMG